MRSSIAVVAALALAMALPAPGQEWGGPFTISPVSAPGTALEVVGGGSAEGTIVSIGTPDGSIRQRWVLQPRGPNLYAISPACAPAMVMAPHGGATDNGTPIVLERPADKPWQLWRIRRDAYGGAVCLQPQHAANKGLDDFAGGRTPGSRQDLWDLNPNDEHLQWILKPLEGARYPKDLPMLGTIKELTFDRSRIFPGTIRKVTVFIPGQYDGAKPACVYVRQDGYNPAEKGMLETLVASGDMPVTVGVFVTPGDLPPDRPGTMGRRNRGLEYDGLGDAFARCITEELLPFVTAELKLNLSSSGNDRCIAGCSSGGICAFNAAWERPDLFTRVYANSGSFVAFRGGHEFPTWVRKFEPRPIRAYLTTGTQDMENCAGDWYLLDQEMDKALKFSGYDYQFHALEGGHGVGWNEHFMAAMRFIWKGWPTPVPVPAGAPRAQDIIIAGEGWQAVPGLAGGPTALAANSRGDILFLQAGRIGCISASGKVTDVATGVQASELAVGPRDEVYTVSTVTGKVIAYDRAGKPRQVADGMKAGHACAYPDGSLYLSCPPVRAGSPGKVWLLKAGRKTLVDSGLKLPTGLAYRPDQWLLQVADGASRWAYSYSIGKDGKLGNRERYFNLLVGDADDDAGAGPVLYSREGRILIGTRLGVQVCADDGPTQVVLPAPVREPVIGMALGGADHDLLTISTRSGIWRRRAKVHGIGAYSPWQAVGGTPL